MINSTNNNNSNSSLDYPKFKKELKQRALSHLSTQFFDADFVENYESRPLNQKYKILGITDPSGGGHIAAIEAVESALAGTCEVIRIEPFKELPGENKFNELQKTGQTEMLGLLTKMQILAEAAICPLKIRPELIKTIETVKPDMIISVVPLANFMTYELAYELKIPMIVITTDLENHHFFHLLKNPGPSLKAVIPFDDEKLRKPLRELYNFKDENFLAIGYPNRTPFTQTDEELAPKMKEICTDLNIGSQDKVVMIMMGAQGMGDMIVNMASQIANSNKELNNKVHVIALCGNNKELQNKTQQIKGSNPNVIIHALDRKEAHYIAALMRLSHLLISKPGGSTVNEAIASDLYTLYFSQYAKNVSWELFNMNYSIEKGYGEEIQVNNFEKQVFTSLERPRLKVSHCPGRNFDKNLQTVVSKMLSQKYEGQAPEFDCKSFFEKQQKFLNEEFSVKDRLAKKLIKRQVKEALINFIKNPQIRPMIVKLLKGNDLNKKNIEDFYRIMSLVNEKGPEAKSKLLKLFFSTQGKNPLKKLENRGIQWFLKHFSMEESLKKSAVYLPSTLINDNSLDPLRAFCEEENISFEKIEKLLQVMSVEDYLPESAEQG